MNKIKKILSLVMAVLMFSANALATEIKEADVRTGYESEFLEILGVMKNDNPEKELTRVDFIQMLSRLMFYGEDYTNIATEENPFIDVENYHYAAYNIERLSQMGVLSGDGNDYAKIDDNITLDEAYVLMLNAAGYGTVAKTYGSYPDNYRKLAHEIELEENISSGAMVTKEIAAKLLVNLMKTPVMKVNVSGEVIYEKGGLFMEEKMGIKLSEGVLKASGDLNITKNTVSENHILIGNMLLENKFGEKADDFVGCNMMFYYIEDTEELIYAYPRRNNVLTLRSEDIIEYKSLKYSYYDENERTRHANVDGGASLVINGIVSENYLDFVPTYGDVKLIDNDNDEDYDVVLVDSYEVAWVSGVINDSMTITFENALSDGISSLSLEDFNEYIVVDENGLECDFDKISQNMLVSLKRYGNEKITVYIGIEAKSGKLETVRDMDSYKEIILDGETHIMAKNPYTKNWDGRVGISVTVYFDIRGNVNAVIQNLDDTWLYGFIIKGKEFTSDTTGLAAVKVKLLTQSGAIETFIIEDEKLRVDGTKTMLSSVSADFTLNRVIRYKTKDSKITAVDFAKDYSMTSETELSFTNGNDLLLRRAAGKYIYRATPKVFKKNTATNEIDGEIIPRDTSVPVFCVPGKTELATAPDKLFSVKKVSDIAGNTSAFMEGYSSDSEDFYCDAIVLFGAQASGISQDGKVPMMIESVTQKLNEEDEIVYEIKGYVQGTKQTYLSSDVIEEDLSRVLSPGDVVKIGLDAQNRITTYQIVYSKNGGGMVSDKNSNTHRYDEGNLERYAFGYAKSIKNGVMFFKNMDDGYPEFHKLDMVQSVLIYDSKDKRNPVRTGSVKDILTMENSATGYDKILLLTVYTDQKCIWVMK